MNPTYRIIRQILVLMITIFFREIKTRGMYQVPKKGSIIFAISPHHNQFVDPLLISKSYTCKPVHFIVAAKTMRRLFVGLIAKLFGGIGVERAQDCKLKGIGFVMCKGESFCFEDPVVHIKEALPLNQKLRFKIFGYGTEFTRQLKPNDQLRVQEEMLKVISIESDDEVLVDCTIANDWDKLFIKNKFEIWPRMNQADMFKEVTKKIQESSAIGIFPEGGSHDRPDFLPFKPGIAMMALGALAEHPELDLSIVPVGLHYFHPDVFRSRAVVEFGPPIKISKELIKKYVDKSTKREAVSELMELILAESRSITVTSPDIQALEVAQAVRRMYKPMNKKLTIPQKLELTRRLISGYVEFRKNSEKVKLLENDVLFYNQQLQLYGLKDHQVEKTAINSTWAFGLLIARSSILFVFSLVILPFGIFNAPILIIAAKQSQIKQKEALEQSTVKVKAKDVLATWKVLIGLVLVPAFYSLYTLIYYLFLRLIGYTVLVAGIYAFIFFIILPTGSYVALISSDHASDIISSLNPLFHAAFPSANQPTDQLRALRRNLSYKLNEVVNEIGPKLFPDFNTFYLQDKYLDRQSSFFDYFWGTNKDVINAIEDDSMPLLKITKEYIRH